MIRYTQNDIANLFVTILTDNRGDIGEDLLVKIHAQVPSFMSTFSCYHNTSIYNVKDTSLEADLPIKYKIVHEHVMFVNKIGIVRTDTRDIGIFFDRNTHKLMFSVDG
jgi:hypothetical protein